MPSQPSADDTTQILRAAREGDRGAVDALFCTLYEQLHTVARQQRRRWEGDDTLNTTALIHEAYLKLVDQERADWRDRAHFYATAATAMRHILVNYAERQRAAKRGGGSTHVPLSETAHAIGGPNPVPAETAAEVLALHDALERLEEMSERQCRVVECRFFAGLPISETATALGVSSATVKRDWAAASAWLHRELRPGRNGTDVDRGEVR